MAAPASPGQRISRTYLRVVCGGVPVWEVEGFIFPRDDGTFAGDSAAERDRRHQLLLNEAQFAERRSELHRAYLLTEQAYAMRPSTSTLLVLTELRARMGERPSPALHCSS